MDTGCVVLVISITMTMLSLPNDRSIYLFSRVFYSFLNLNTTVQYT